MRVVQWKQIESAGEDMKVSAIILAAGSSTRMGGGVSKVLLPLRGEPVLLRTLRAFDGADCISEIIVAARETDHPAIAELAKQVSTPVRLSPGGATRQGSVAKAASLCLGADVIAVHDGARPFVTPALIRQVCDDAEAYGAAALAVPVKDTVKLADTAGFVDCTPERSLLRNVQTPQVFRAGLFYAALQKAETENKDYTDDCQLVEAAGGRIFLTMGDYRNIKLTTPEDMLVAEAFCKAMEEDK